MYSCMICDVPLNSHEQKISHQKGKTHQKKLVTKQRAQELFSGSSISRHCSICNVTLTSEITALDHFEGKSHKKREKALEKHNCCKLQLKSCEFSILGNKLTVNETRSQSNGNATPQQSQDTAKRASVDPVPGRHVKMNGCYSTINEFLTGANVQSKSNIGLINGESQSGLGDTRLYGRENYSLGHDGQWQLEPNIARDNCHATSTRDTGYSSEQDQWWHCNGYKSETLSMEGEAGIGPRTVGFGRPSSLSLASSHSSDEEVQSPMFEVHSPTADTSSLHSTNISQLAQQFEIEKRVMTAIRGGGRKYWSFQDIATEFPVNVSQKQLVAVMLELENKRILHRVSHNPPIWSLVIDSKPSTVASTLSNPSPANTKIAYSNGFFEEGTSLDSPLSDVFDQVFQLSSTVSRPSPVTVQQMYSSKMQVHPTVQNPTSPHNLGGIAESELSQRRGSGDNYGLFPVSPVSHESFAFSSIVSSRNQNSFSTFALEETPLQQAVPSSPMLPSPPLSSFPEHSSFQEHKLGIVDFLRKINRPARALEISKALGLTSKKDVNFLLYQLERSAVVYKVPESQPPLWALSPPKRRASHGPGVIGEERRRGSNDYEEISSSVPFRRSHSSCGLANLGEAVHLDSRRECSKPRARTFGPPSSGSQETFFQFCEYCKVPLNSLAQAQEHLKSTKHRNRLAKMVFRDYPTFCEYCKVHLNSESQANEHFSSSRHEQTVAKSQKAPVREHPDLHTELRVNPTTCTKTTPYSYQLELYTKAMVANTVCFLPTGTGKTLVSALVIAHMLHINPTRQAIFLVDRVLLVLQQSEYLKKELSNVKVQDPKRGERPIRIGAICGEMRKLEHGARIYEHDLLVITADCYRNHLNNGTLRFDDVSLIVLDESHHCNKDHPYNVIIRDYYLGEFNPRHHKPKILGLTASPAGETNLDRTVKKLQRLLGNLGGATLLTVTENVGDLKEKTSRAQLVCLCTEYTPAESQLLHVLVEYSTKCFNLAVRVSELRDYKDIFQPPAGVFLSSDDIYSISRVIDNIMMLSRSDGNALNSLLHLQSVCDAVCTLQECGETVALDGLVELKDDGCPHGFDWAETMGLPCSVLKSSLEQHISPGFRRTAGVSGVDSGVGELVEQLLSLDWDRAPSRGCPRPIALVLVKRRRTAHCLVKFLTNCPELCRRGVSTTCIVGHGARSTDGGMSVNKQKEIITHIREGRYQVIVATSVAEEGLDLPVCELVIQMDPPSSVTALVQVRGRARHKNAVFVAICRDEEQAKRIEDLLKREANMQEAARQINGQYH